MENINNRVMNNKRFKEFCYNQQEILYYYVDNDINFIYGIDFIYFDFDGVPIVNPFIDETDFKEVNPITHYGEYFLNSDFIKLLDMLENKNL